MKTELVQHQNLRLVRIVIWFVSSLSFFILYVTAGLSNWTEAPFYLFDALLGYTFSGLVLSATRRTWIASGWKRYAYIVVTVFLLSVINALIDTPVISLIKDYDVYTQAWEDDFLATLQNTLLLGGQTFVLIVWIHAFFAAYAWTVFRAQQLVEQQSRLAAAESLAQKAILSALRAQVNPHFLFNALNAIASLIASGRNTEAEEALLRLSEFFRASLSAERQQTVTVADELEMLDAYLEMEQLRFPDRLDVSINMEEESSGALIPSFLLQPLVENAIKYAVAPAKEPVHVEVNARVEGDTLILRVEDDGKIEPSEDSAGEGVGLSNVSNRIEVLYGKNANMTVVKGEPGFRVTIRLPYSDITSRELIA